MQPDWSQLKPVSDTESVPFFSLTKTILPSYYRFLESAPVFRNQLYGLTLHGAIAGRTGMYC